MARHSDNKELQVLKFDRKMPNNEKLLYIVIAIQVLNMIIVLFK